MRRFLIRCPNCGNHQTYLCNSGNPARAYKQCIFCDKKFMIHKHAGNTTIVKEIFDIRQQPNNQIHPTDFDYYKVNNKKPKQ